MEQTHDYDAVMASAEMWKKLADDRLTEITAQRDYNSKAHIEIYQLRQKNEDLTKISKDVFKAHQIWVDEHVALVDKHAALQKRSDELSQELDALRADMTKTIQALANAQAVLTPSQHVKIHNPHPYAAVHPNKKQQSKSHYRCVRCRMDGR